MTQPTRRSPILVNHQGRATRHRFVRFEAAIVTVRDELADGALNSREVSATAHVYACTETGIERRWGLSE
jgi:hypothetical protein